MQTAKGSTTSATCNYFDSTKSAAGTDEICSLDVTGPFVYFAVHNKSGADDIYELSANGGTYP